MNITCREEGIRPDFSEETVSNQFESMRSSSSCLLRRPTLIRVQRTSIDLGRPSTLEPISLPPAREKKWQQVKSQLQGDTPPTNYYDSLPFQPGFGFFKPFLKACLQQKRPLQFNFPEFLLLYKKPVWVKSGEE